LFIFKEIRLATFFCAVEIQAQIWLANKQLGAGIFLSLCLSSLFPSSTLTSHIYREERES
jgi:hypothetical protein